MTTLEYLQLTHRQKTESMQLIDFNSHGIMIDNSTGRVRDWYGNLYLYCEYFVKNNMLHGEYKRWNSDGKLIYYYLYENGEFIKDFLKEK